MCGQIQRIEYKGAVHLFITVPELVRLSIGLEHIDDITGALDDALALI